MKTGSPWLLGLMAASAGNTRSWTSQATQGLQQLAAHEPGPPPLKRPITASSHLHPAAMESQVAKTRKEPTLAPRHVTRPQHTRDLPARGTPERRCKCRQAGTGVHQ